MDFTNTLIFSFNGRATCYAKCIEVMTSHSSIMTNGRFRCVIHALFPAIVRTMKNEMCDSDHFYVSTVYCKWKRIRQAQRAKWLLIILSLNMKNQTTIKMHKEDSINTSSVCIICS